MYWGEEKKDTEREKRKRCGNDGAVVAEKASETEEKEGERGLTLGV